MTHNVLWLCEVRNSKCLIINYLLYSASTKLPLFKDRSPHLAKPLLPAVFYSILHCNLVNFFVFLVF